MSLWRISVGAWLSSFDNLSASHQHEKARTRRAYVNHGYSGAGETNRTPDLLITNQLLYQLSYTGISWQVYGALGGGFSVRWTEGSADARARIDGRVAGARLLAEAPAP